MRSPARAAGATVVVLGPGRAARLAELTRAAAWGLDRRPARDVAWRDLPSVAAGASEIDARRRLLAGASLVLVRRGSRVIGAIDRDRVDLTLPESSLLARLEHGGEARPHTKVRRRGRARAMSGPPQLKPMTGPPQLNDARLWLLRVAGKIGEGLGAPAHAVGGFVRDLLTGSAAPDVDLVVEGDGVAFARRLAEEIGGTVLVHRSFGTASIEGGRAPAGAGLDGRRSAAWMWPPPGVSAMPRPGPCPRWSRRTCRKTCAVATSRSTRWRWPWRRTGSAGCSTRWAARRTSGAGACARSTRSRSSRTPRACSGPLGMSAGSVCRRKRRRSRRSGWRSSASAYVALSGQRLWREIDLAAAELRARPVFERLVRWRATSLWNLEGATSRHLADAERSGGGLRSAGVVVDPAELALLALTLGRPAEAVERSLDRLALAGEPRERIEAAAVAGPLARRLEAVRLSPSAVSALLDTAPRSRRARGLAPRRGPGRAGGSSGTWRRGAIGPG